MDTLNTSRADSAAPEPGAATGPDRAEINEWIALEPGLRQRVDEQVERFIESMLLADAQSEDFRQRMDSVFRLGRKETIDATRLNTAFARRNYRGIEDSHAYQAMGELREIMDALNPAQHGDLLASNKLFGLLPGGSKLKSYLRKFQSASTQIDKLVAQLCAAQDDLERDVIAIDDAKAQLWAALQNLKAAAHFAQRLQEKLRERVEGLRMSDPIKARALEQEALFYAAQCLEGILAQESVTVNGYLALEPLKRTARELSIGIDRLKTSGMSALSIAQMLAIATGNQIKVQQTLSRTREVIGNLIVQSSAQLGEHVQRVAKHASDPLIEVAQLQTAFDNTFKALDELDNFRSNAIGNMLKNNQALQALIDKSKEYVERAARGASEAAPALPGPVAL